MKELPKKWGKAGFKKTAEQCRDRIKKLKNNYKKKRDAQQTSGAGRHDWPFFGTMNAVLGTRHATEPPITYNKNLKEMKTRKQVKISRPINLVHHSLHQA